MDVTTGCGVPLRALFVGIDETTTQTIADRLELGGYRLTVERIGTRARLRRALRAGRWDIAFAGLSNPKCNAFVALAIIEDSGQAIPLVVIGGNADREEVSCAIRAGARDFVRTDRMEWIVPNVQRELRAAHEHATQQSALAARDAHIRELTERLQHRQKMHLLGSLVGGIAHDFNNMLSVVMSYARAALEDSAPAEPLREDLSEIVKAADSAAELSRRLLGFAKPQPASQVVVDVNAVVAGMENMLRRVIGEQIELVIALAPDLPRVRVGHGQVEQILMNLVVNARDAMPMGGRLQIATSATAPGGGTGDGAPAREKVTLMVSDTGVGMDAATRARIFEPFFTTKPEGKGTGLGLSTVLEIVRQNGGAVILESQSGRGTTFRIELDADIAGAPRSVEVIGGRTGPAPSKAELRVLVVEDDAPLLRCIERTLSRQGIEVLATSSAEEALFLIDGSAEELDLLICDVVLPGISGPALVERIAAKNCNIPVLYMSGYPDELLVGRGFIKPMDAIYRKPLHPAALARQIREMIDRKPFFRPS
jgi:two-component system cell cycle sensor histidine kinase/response regulator CckA